MLSEEDKQILEWEKSRREISEQCSCLCNNEEKEALWRKSQELHKKIYAKIYSADRYRDDKKHLLINGRLSIALLED